LRDRVGQGGTPGADEAPAGDDAVDAGGVVLPDGVAVTVLVGAALGAEWPLHAAASGEAAVSASTASARRVVRARASFHGRRPGAPRSRDRSPASYEAHDATRVAAGQAHTPPRKPLMCQGVLSQFDLHWPARLCDWDNVAQTGWVGTARRALGIVSLSTTVGVGR
jgi:hypothetical protein